MASPHRRGQLRYASAEPGPRRAWRAVAAAVLLAVPITLELAPSARSTSPLETPSAAGQMDGAPAPSGPRAQPAHPEAQLVLEVVDPDGAPIAGASLLVEGRPVASADPLGILRLPRPLPARGEVRAEGFVSKPLDPTATSRRVVLARALRPVQVVDAQGRAVGPVALVLDDGRVREARPPDTEGKHTIPTSFRGQLVAHDPERGSATVEVEPGDGALLVRLERAVVLSVEVFGPDGVPAANVPVWWRPLGVARRCAPADLTGVRTDGRGRAALTGASMPGEVCAEPGPGLRACASAASSVVRLLPGPVLCAEVVATGGPEGSPRPGVARVSGPGGYARGLALPGVLDDVPVDAELELEVDVPGFGVFRERRRAASRLELALPAPAEVRLVVAGPREAFPAVLVLEGPERREVPVSTPGPLVVDGLGPGPYTVSLSGPGGLMEPLVLTLSPDERRDLGTVRLGGGGSIEVRGRGWVSLRVEATGALASVADLGPGGSHAFTALPEGWMTVLRRAGPGWVRASRVWVAPGPPVVVDLDSP